MSHSKSLFLRPHLPDECMRVLDCVFFSSNELRNLACGDGGKKGKCCPRVCLCVCMSVSVCGGDRVLRLRVELYSPVTFCFLNDFYNFFYFKIFKREA